MVRGPGVENRRVATVTACSWSRWWASRRAYCTGRGRDLQTARYSTSSGRFVAVVRNSRRRRRIGSRSLENVSGSRLWFEACSARDMAGRGGGGLGVVMGSHDGGFGRRCFWNRYGSGGGRHRAAVGVPPGGSNAPWPRVHIVELHAWNQAWKLVPQFRQVTQSPLAFCFSSQSGHSVHDEP